MNRSDEVLKALETSKGLADITLEEYLQVSFLALISGSEPHIEQTIMYGGNVFYLHACVSQINPVAPVEAVRNKV